MIIKIPDELFEKFGSQEELEKFLRDNAGEPLGEGSLVLSPEQVSDLAEWFGKTPVDGAELAQLVKRVGRVRVQKQVFYLSAPAVKRLKACALANVGIRDEDGVDAKRLEGIVSTFLANWLDLRIDSLLRVI